MLPFSAAPTSPAPSTSTADAGVTATTSPRPPHWDDPTLNSVGGKAGEPLAPPWTYSKDLTKIKHYTKRMSFLMQVSPPYSMKSS